MGHKFWTSRLAVLSAVIGVSTLWSADLDIAAARQAYQSKQAIAERAASVTRSKKSIYDSANSRLSSAQSAHSRARSQLSAARSAVTEIDSAISRMDGQLRQLEEATRRDEQKLRSVSRDISDLGSRADGLKRQSDQLGDQIGRLNSRIRQLQSQGGSGAWTCNYVDRGWEEHRGGHPATNASKAAAKSRAEQICLAAHDRCRFAGCSQPPSTELRNAIRRRDSLVSQKNGVDRQKSQVVSELNRKKSEAGRLRSAIAKCRTDIDAIHNRLSQARSERTRRVWAVDEANRELNRKSSDLAHAQREKDSTYRDYYSAQQISQARAREASQAYAYLQQVIGNYNRALAVVYAQAESAADQHAKAEAESQAISQGALKGEELAQSLGAEKGSEDAKKRDYALGYREGREQASSASGFSEQYQTAIAQGQRLALHKARAEEFPKGYNQALQELLKTAPANLREVDISEGLSEEPGEGGQDLDSKQMAVGSRAGPAHPIAEVPAGALPVFPGVSVESPQAQFTQSSPPCTGLVLSEFEPLCRTRYRDSYASAFAKHFEVGFKQGARDEYTQQIEALYQASFTPKAEESFVQGKTLGVVHQGELDGFSQSLEQAKSDQFAAGQIRLSELLAGGNLIVYRSASFTDENNDGVLSPNEAVSLTVVIDNYGEKSTLKENLRLVLKGEKGVGTVSVRLRNLPSLEAQSRTELTGVLSAKIVGKFSGSSVELKAELQRQVGEEFVKLAELTLAERTGYPIELTQIDLEDSPTINEEVEATLTFTNRTNIAQPESPLQFWSAPEFVKVPDQELSIPKLSPGESAQVPVKVKALPYIGSNTEVNFVARTKPHGLENTMDQNFGQSISVDRSASLLLFDTKGNALRNSTLRVSAGSYASFVVQMKYHRNVELPGPFKFELIRKSHNEMSLPSGTTVGVTYGQWWPSRRADALTYHYWIPQSMKGKSAWVMFGLWEGSKALHYLMVYVQVQ